MKPTKGLRFAAKGENDSPTHPISKGFELKSMPEGDEFDGMRLTRLSVAADLQSWEDFDKLIHFLEISKRCFPNPRITQIQK